MQDAVATRSSHPRTGPIKKTAPRSKKSGPQGEAQPKAQPKTQLPIHPEEPEGIAAVLGAATLAFSAGMLLARGLRAGSLPTIAAALAGGPMAYRRVTGRWPIPPGVSRRIAEQARPISIEASVTVGRPAAELYEAWRRLQNLPRFMRHLESVRETSDGRSHWVATTPAGGRVQWDAEIVEDRPGQLLSWRSLADSPVDTAGSVLFEEAPGGRGTLVRVVMDLGAARTSDSDGSAGLNGDATLTALSLFSGLAGKTAEMQIREDLRRFKELLEAGEIPTTEGQPHGPRGAIDLKNPL